MPPLHLHILAAHRSIAARIEQVLQSGEPDCTTQIVADAPDLLQAVAKSPDAVGIAVAPSVSPALRHELNNQLALIRMLSDILAESPGLSPLLATKAREIGNAAEAAAQAIRRAHNSSTAGA